MTATTNPTFKFLTADNVNTYINNAILWCAAKHMDADDAYQFLSNSNFKTLFPKSKLPDEERFEKKYTAVLKRNSKSKFNSPTFLLQFVLDIAIAESITDPADLVITNKTTSRTYKLSAREIAFIYKTISRLTVLHRRKYEGNPEKQEWCPIYNKYFLGEIKHKTKIKVPKFRVGITPFEAYMMGFKEAATSKLSEDTKNSYSEKFKRRTGRTLNNQKLALILKLLEKYGWVERIRANKDSDNNLCAFVYKLGPKLTEHRNLINSY